MTTQTYTIQPVKRFDIVDGHHMVNGEPRGFNWKPMYEVSVWFENKEQAEKFEREQKEKSTTTQ